MVDYGSLLSLLKTKYCAVSDKDTMDKIMQKM